MTLRIILFIPGYALNFCYKIVPSDSKNISAMTNAGRSPPKWSSHQQDSVDITHFWWWIQWQSNRHHLTINRYKKWLFAISLLTWPQKIIIIDTIFKPERLSSQQSSMILWLFCTILVGCCIDFAQESPQKLYFRSFVHWIPFAPCHDTFLLQRQPLQPFLPTINFQRVLKWIFMVYCWLGMA